MKKTLTKIVAIATTAAMTLALGACNTQKEDRGLDTTNHKIVVGNTAAVTGKVGKSFNYALDAYFWNYNTKTPYKDADGNAYTIEVLNYDEGASSDANAGIDFTKKLVEDDKIFAIVGHYGTNTISGTVDYLEDVGIPMVYGVGGANDLFQTERNIMTIQPVYDIEGQHMVATAFAAKDKGGLGATKLGIIYSDDEGGKGMLQGIQKELKKENKAESTYVIRKVAGGSDAADDVTAVEAIKNAGCDVVIMATQVDAFPRVMGANSFKGYNPAVLTSYVNANTTVLGGLIASGGLTDERPVYTGAWLNTGSAPNPEYKGWNDYVDYVKLMTAYAQYKNEDLIKDTDPIYGLIVAGLFGTITITSEAPYYTVTYPDWCANGVSSKFLDSYAMAGYVGASVFCEGLTRLQGKEVKWSTYIDAMEQAVIDIPMGTNIDYRNGKREGVDIMAINLYTASAGGVAALYRDFNTVEEIRNGQGVTALGAAA